MPYNDEQGTLKLLKRTYAEQTRRTIFFIGAGVSVESGLPTWYELRETLHQEINGILGENSSDGDLEVFRDLEALLTENKFWEYFEFAEENWPTTYQDVLDRKINLDYSHVPTPVVYEKLWNMRHVRQLATLNVDGLIDQAFRMSPASQNGKLLQYDGYNVTDSQTFIAKDAYCVLNLHGTVYQKSRWVMSAAERRKLTTGGTGKKYKSFMTWLFQSHNIVFIGINPTDIAISPAFTAAKNSGILGSHFWLCPTPSHDTRQWAQSQSIRLVSYEPDKLEDGTQVHSSIICSILDDLEQYASPELEVELPTSRPEVDPSQIMTNDNFVKLVYEDRKKAVEMLSGSATLLGRQYGYTSTQLRQFIRSNSLAIQIATAVDEKEIGHNSLSKYKLHNKIQGGGSSSVWLCEDETHKGEYLILKILNGVMHEDDAERQSFRRGIESMYLLNDVNTPIAPKYLDHLELPLAVVMEHINGSTLRDVISTGDFSESRDILRLFFMICDAIRNCHSADGHVLHRDLKPGNILFEDWYPGYEKSDLLESRTRLINFDLSWHRYSSGNTKAISADESGYYAPEQKGVKNSAPPRSASTDAYMLGMILFFLISEDNPPEGGAGLSDWMDQVRTVVNRRFQGFLVSRVSRLIQMMTDIDMNSRLDVEAAQAEVQSILFFLDKDYKNVDHDMMVEYVISLTGKNYIWNPDKIEGHIHSAVHADFSVRYQQKGMKCELLFSRSRSDSDARKGFGARMNQKIREGIRTLEDAGWDCDEGGGVIKSLRATIGIISLVEKADLGKSEIETIANRLLQSIE